jgi:hypothetical protein
MVLKMLTIDNFLDPVCQAVTKTLEKFEVRGFRPRSLNAFKLSRFSWKP